MVDFSPQCLKFFFCKIFIWSNLTPFLGFFTEIDFSEKIFAKNNEISFKIAASLAFKEACKSIKPTILEPSMEVVITIKDEYVGDIMSDIPQRRGSVVGMEPVGNGKTAITAQIPEAEIIKYTIDLKAMTQGSGYFTRRFIRYDDVPSNLVDKIVAEYKKDN